MELTREFCRVDEIENKAFLLNEYQANSELFLEMFHILRQLSTKSLLNAAHPHRAPSCARWWAPAPKGTAQLVLH